MTDWEVSGHVFPYLDVDWPDHAWPVDTFSLTVETPPHYQVQGVNGIDHIILAENYMEA